MQGANQSTARPFLSTDGEILAPFGASCARPDSAIFLALSTSEQVTIISFADLLKFSAVLANFSSFQPAANFTLAGQSLSQNGLGKPNTTITSSLHGLGSKLQTGALRVRLVSHAANR